MSDKQQEFQFDIEYITIAPEKATQRYIEAYTDSYNDIDVDITAFYEILSKMDYQNVPVSGDYEGYDFVIFDSWEQVANITAVLNGWRGGRIKNIFNRKNLDKLSDDTEVNRNTKVYHQWIVGLEQADRVVADLDDFLSHNWGFSDEYSLCTECNENIIRTSPNCYDWTPEYYEGDCFIACLECCKDIQEDILTDREGSSFPNFIDPGDHDLVKVNDNSFENGFHHGMDDDPDKMVELLHSHGIDCWFEVHPSQFYIDFDLYVKTADFERTRAIINNPDADTTCDISPARALERGLQAASKQVAEHKDSEGINYTKIDTNTGEAKTRIVSKEEFINGIK